jgi:hypothetical protein
MRASAPPSMRSLPQPASPAAPSQRERKEAAKRTSAVRTFGLPSHQPLRRQLPPGEAKGLPHFRALSTGRDISFRSQTARPERRRVGRAWKASFGGWESRGKGACKEPFPLACSFLTIFLHEQKGGAPGGRSSRSRRAQPRPVKRITAPQSVVLSLFRSLCAAKC